MTNKTTREVASKCARCGGRFCQHVSNKAQWCEDCLDATEAYVTKGA